MDLHLTERRRCLAALAAVGLSVWFTVDAHDERRSLGRRLASGVWEELHLDDGHEYARWMNS